RHRDRSGMTSLPGKSDEHTARSRDGRNDADRQVERFQDWPLLDMNFDVTEQIIAAAFRLGESVGIATKGADRLRHRNTGIIGQAQQVWLERTSDHSTPKIGGVIAQTLLIGKGKHFEREGKALIALVQQLNAGQSGQHTKLTIIFACIAHRIEVRTNQQSFGLSMTPK